MIGAHLYTFQAQETQDSPQVIPPELLTRVYCHVMISMMPNEVLPELVEGLRDLENQFLKPTQPAGPSVSSPSMFTAKIGEPIARPGFYLDRE
jgi:hypothetical protein